MKLTAEVLTLILTALKLAGLTPLPWIVVVAPVVIKYGFWTWVTWRMARGRSR